MDDINKESNKSNEQIFADAFDGTVDDGQFRFCIVSDKPISGNWMPDKSTVCRMEVLAIENKNNFTGAPLVTKGGKTFLNLRIRATDTTNPNNFRIVYQAIYSNNKEKAYIITKALGVDIPNLCDFKAIVLVNAIGYAEIDSQAYTAQDGTPKRKAVISKWLLDFDVSTLPAVQEDLPF